MRPSLFLMPASLLAACWNGTPIHPTLLVTDDPDEIATALAARNGAQADTSGSVSTDTAGGPIDTGDTGDTGDTATPGGDTDTADPRAAIQCGDGCFLQGEPVYIAWILPKGVPDPSEAATLRIETACTSETLSVPFAHGAAQTVIDAPLGAEGGILVAVSVLNGSDSDTTERADEAGVVCPEADDTDAADDTDPGTTG